jgi:MFS family permease
MFFTQRSTGLIYTGAALLALGNGIMWPSVISILSRRAGDRYQGAVQGFASSCGAAASILGLLVGGVLFDTLGANVFVIAAALILSAFFMALGLRGGTRRVAQPA